MKKIYLLFLCSFLSLQSNDGALDTSFGTGGTVTTSQAASALLQQPDGKLVTCGSTFLARYSPEGNLDGAFGANGTTTLPDSCDSLALQPDGKIIAAGSDGSVFTTFRYNANGSIDTSFGPNGTGRVTTNFTGSDRATACLLQPDGKIVVVGVANIFGGNFAVVRYNSDGLPDTGFGSNGTVTTDFGGDDWAFGVALQSDGKIIAVGRGNNTFALVRYNADGSLDSSFGTGGIVTTARSTSNNVLNDVILQKDNKIVVTGYENGESTFIIGRYLQNGSIDEDFADDGFLLVSNIPISYGQSVFQQPDNKIVAIGRIGADAAVARCTQQGSLDYSFGNKGIVLIDVSGLNNWGSDGLMLPDGKVMILGNVSGNLRSLTRLLIPSIKISSFARDLRAKFNLIKRTSD